MSFEAAELVATIQLGGADKADRDLSSFKSKLEQTDRSASKLGQTAEATFRAAAVGIGVASTAAVAYVSNLFKTGVAYNTLQQTSRAALKTLVGGAEQANAQMDKLDAFAKTSPFSKSVFITAQQQLLGFGLQAEKVIPALSAVQDAVAAVGGSNEQVSRITYTLAQMRGQGKLTGETLNELGQYGIDAAEIIGSRMGKTGAEIRDMASKPGGIPADQVWDLLVDGLQSKFAGASAGVKQTFTGTVDRIKAASRDIGAALAEPFVGKNGGGLFVTWGNQVADVMRAVEGHVAPVVSMLTARAMPAFAGITETLDKAKVQVKTWDSSQLDNSLNQLGAHGPAIAATAGAILGVNSQLLASLPIVGRFIPGFSPIVGILAGAAAASPAVRKEFAGLVSSLKPLVPVTVEVAKVASQSLNAVLPVVASGIRAVTAVAGPAADIISRIPTPMLATAAAGVAVYSALRSNLPMLESFVNGWKRLAEQAAVQKALSGMSTEIGSTATGIGAAAKAAESAAASSGIMSTAFGMAGRAATGLGVAIKSAFLSNPIGWIILGVSTAATILTGVLTAQAEAAQKAQERIDGYRETLSETGETTERTTAKIRESLEKFSDIDFWKWLDGGKSRAAADWVAKVGGAEQAMIKFGTTSKLTSDAVRSGGPAYDALVASLKRVGSETERTLQGTSGVYKDTLTDQASAANVFLGYVEEQRAAVEAATRIQTEFNEKQREAAAAMSETARSNTRINEALAILRDTSSDASTKLKALTQALDELNGGTKSQEDLTQQLNDRTRSLAEAFAVADENGNKLADSLIKSNGQIDTATAAGSALRTQVTGLADDYKAAMIAAQEQARANGQVQMSAETAAGIYATYSGRLREAAESAGVAGEKLDAFVHAALASPEVVRFTLSDDGSIDGARLRLIDLAQQVLATPDKTITISDGASIAAIENQLAAMGFHITHLPNGSVQVVASGVDSVEQAISWLARDRTTWITVRSTGDIIDTSGHGRQVSGYADGGPVFGAGSAKSDSIPARLSVGEHVWTAADTAGAGGHGKVQQLRYLARTGRLGEIAPGFASGGPVGAISTDRLPALSIPLPRSVPPASPGGSAQSGSAADLSRVLALLEKIAAGPDGANAVVLLLQRIAAAVESGRRDPKSDAWNAAQIM